MPSALLSALLAPSTPRAARLVERRGHKVGLPPGTLVTPEAPPAPARLHAFHYTAEAIEESDAPSVPEACALAGRDGTTWINVDGVADVAAVAALGEAFGLHPLVQEDLTHTAQRPKLEVYDRHVFVVARMVHETDADPVAAYATAGARGRGHRTEQVAFVLGDGYLLSFQEAPGDVFEAVRQRLRKASGRVRQNGADYLLYALLDVIVDHYFVTLERIGDATEALEAAVLDRPEARVQAAITGLRREVVVLRRAVWPLREVLAAMQREDTPFMAERTRIYVRDAYDHLVQTVEILESLREVLGGLADLYLSAIGMRQNEVMKTLTVVSSVFIPLTFLAGIYGMNFDVMPELHTRYGYFILLGAMAALAGGTLLYFRRRGWI